MDSPLAHTIDEVCEIARAGRTAVYEAIQSGALRAVKRGRRTLVLNEDLRDWVQRLPAIEVKTAGKVPPKNSRRNLPAPDPLIGSKA